MKKVIMFLVVIMFVLGLSVASSLATPPAYWDNNKTVLDVYRLDLGGVAPTATQMSNNNIRVASIVIDTSTSTAYFMLNPPATTAIKFVAGTATFDGIIVSTGGAYTNGGVAFSNLNGYVSCSNLQVVGSVDIPDRSLQSLDLPAILSSCTLMSNGALVVSCSNFQMVAGGTFTAPAGILSIAHMTNLYYNPCITQEIPGVATNVYWGSGLLKTHNP